jgi:hypothetical protein
MTHPTDALRLDEAQRTAIEHAAMDANADVWRHCRLAMVADREIVGYPCFSRADMAELARLYEAAPASPLPGGGWQDVSTFTESGQGSPVIVAVPTKEGGWIVGEAWKSVMEPDDPYRGNDGWWWAGTELGDAYNDPIRFMNHGDAEWWMPLPAAPTGDA